MTMQTVVELSEKDIIQTIANALDVDARLVTLKYTEEWRVHGPNEYKERVVSARVILKGGKDGAADD
jgi:hypothetical protein